MHDLQVKGYINSSAIQQDDENIRHSKFGRTLHFSKLFQNCAVDRGRALAVFQRKMVSFKNLSEWDLDNKITGKSETRIYF